MAEIISTDSAQVPVEPQPVTNENLAQAIKELQQKLDTAMVAINLTQLTLALNFEKVQSIEKIVNIESLSGTEKLAQITAAINAKIVQIDADNK